MFAAMDIPSTDVPKLQTKILPVDMQAIGDVDMCNLDRFITEHKEENPSLLNLLKAAMQLRETAIPVAFPTETVYGLGADATRSEAVRGIYKAKQRPLDNPLIVHICSLDQLRGLLKPGFPASASLENGTCMCNDQDPIPEIYRPLIQRFWPGPLTILLANPPNSILATEVTAGLPTFGARMPSSSLALALISLAGVPLAAPSANASTKPSPTKAEHVKHDLNGRIETVLDGGPCTVGVESTVVDGLSHPPVILRPGGISIEQLKECPGWENIVIGYKDSGEIDTAPRAPGMKYKHYSPRAKVVLFEAGGLRTNPRENETLSHVNEDTLNIGVIRTKHWEPFSLESLQSSATSMSDIDPSPKNPLSKKTGNRSPELFVHEPFNLIPFSILGKATIHDVYLGDSSVEIARNLFTALRELDLKGVDVILVEGIDNRSGEGAAAVMNRLRKAAEVIICR
jgi:L-threonylcarbamoyladenylate synthase